MRMKAGIVGTAHEGGLSELVEAEHRNFFDELVDCIHLSLLRPLRITGPDFVKFVVVFIFNLNLLHNNNLVI